MLTLTALDYNNTTPLIPFLSGVLPPIPQYVQLFIYEDGLEEETEGLILFVDIPESLLDPRDVGQIDLLRSAFLVTINESGRKVTHFVKFELNLVYLLTMGACFYNIRTCLIMHRDVIIFE